MTGRKLPANFTPGPPSMLRKTFSGKCCGTAIVRESLWRPKHIWEAKIWLRIPRAD